MRSLIIAAALLPTTLAGCQKQPSPPLAANKKAATKTDIYAVAAKSQWWSAIKSADDIAAIADRITECNSGTVVWMDSDGKFSTAPASHYQATQMREWYLHLPAGMNQDRHFFILVDGERRWTREMAAKELLRAIEKAEFSQGAGR